MNRLVIPCLLLTAALVGCKSEADRTETPADPPKKTAAPGETKPDARATLDRFVTLLEKKDLAGAAKLTQLREPDVIAALEARSGLVVEWRRVVERWTSGPVQEHPSDEIEKVLKRELVPLPREEWAATLKEQAWVGKRGNKLEVIYVARDQPLKIESISIEQLDGGRWVITELD